MLQINANPNEDIIILYTFNEKKHHIHSLRSNEIYEFDIPIVDINNKIWNLATNNGLVFVNVVNNSNYYYYFLNYNPITQECIKLPQLLNQYLHSIFTKVACTFLKHDFAIWHI